MIQGDTIYQDSLISSTGIIQEETPVLIGGSIKTQDNYPFSENLNLSLSPDWIFYFAIAMISIFAWIKLIYARFTFDIFESSVNYQVSLRLYNNANIVQKRISLIFSILYFLSFSVYLFLVLEYFEFQPADLQDLPLVFSILGLLVAISLLRTLFFRVTGIVFNREKLFNEASFHNSLFNKLIAVLSLPFILIIAYVSDIYLDITIYLSLFLMISVNILRLIRELKFAFKNVISYFYFILYLCSLEIVPILVIIKVVYSL